MESLAANTFIVMVGKLHADRVTQYLLGKGSQFDLQDQAQNETDSNDLSLGISHQSNNDETTAANNAESHAEALHTVNENVQILDDSVLSGVSRARRGYFLLLIKNATRSIATMSPMGRQNVSFIGRLTHCMTKTSSEESTAAEVAAATFAMVWDTMQSQGFDINQHLLRMECYPRNQNDYVCQQLDLAAVAKMKTSEPVSESQSTCDRPIPLTASRNKCTHRLTIVLLADRVYWGLEHRDQHQDTIQAPLNDLANAEITTTPCHPDTMEDLTDNVSPTTPLSRAYYKLDEVWNDYLQAHADQLELGEGSVGLDIGASPGGWTQVLVHSVKCSQVVALDPAKLAQRIMKQPQVTHVACRLDSSDAAEDKAGAEWTRQGPFRIVVCDASVLWHTLLDGLVESFKRLHMAWSLPATFVITMKLPFKTLLSIQRQVRQINERIPAFAKDLAQILFPGRTVNGFHRLVHLMANSDSERTLILVFNEKK